MRKFLLAGVAAMSFPLMPALANDAAQGQAVAAGSISTTLYAVSAAGRGQPVGTIVALPAPKPEQGDPGAMEGGVVLIPRLVDLPPGEHGFHLHANPSCDPAPDDHNRIVPAGAAGGHFDPAGTNIHAGPGGLGHLGDLPVLVVEPDGTVNRPLSVPLLTLADMVGRSLVIDAGGDTYADIPQPDGGGGRHIACGVVGRQK